MKRYIIAAVALALLIAARATADPDKLEVYTQLMEQFSDLKTISIDFNSLSNPALKGQLKARKGGAFNLKLPGRTIISDGKTLWNYAPSRKQVTVSTIEDSKETGFEEIFFSLLKRYQPSNLKKEVSSKFGSMYVLKMEPGGEKIKSINSFVIKLDEKTLKIKQIAIERDGSWETWYVSNYKTDENFSESDFRFTPQKGVEIIDLR